MNKTIEDIFKNHKRKHGEDLYKVEKIPYKKDDMRLLEKLMKTSLRPTRVGSKSSKPRSSFSNFNNKNQRVIFKMSRSYFKKVHEKYLKTYMPQNNKLDVIEKPILFGTEQNEYAENMAALHHKCIISPENQNVNLELLANEFIKRIEVLTGYKLYWQAAIHNDTNHRHLHLCINGKDKDEQDVYFPKEMVKTTMRETLSYIATLMVGERSNEEIEIARNKMTSQKRWTNLDEELESYGEKISLHNLSQKLLNRLAFLSELNLAHKNEHCYTLSPSWKEVLVATGRYNTFFEHWQKYEGNLELYAGGKISGVCKDIITFDKDEAWNDAVIINTGAKNIYVPIWQLTKENLLGKNIEIQGGSQKLARQVTSKDIRVLKNKSYTK